MKKTAKHRSIEERNFRTNQRIAVKSSAIVLILSAVVVVPSLTSSQASFVSESSATVNAKSTSIEPPTNLTVKSVRAGETDIAWIASKSDFVTGYKVLRSESKYGPWAEIGTANGRTTTTYVDKNIGSKTWNYRVESFMNGWMSTGPAFEAPPAVGLSFYDTFSTPGNLDGRKTTDGKSSWQVWSGEILIDYRSGWTYAAHASGYETKPAVGVVRTPTQNAVLFGRDFDGSEAFVLRGKDPLNYIYAGGAMGPVADDGSFEIVEYRDGVRNVLWTGYTGAIDRDMRLVINGTKIEVYIDAINGQPNSGKLFAAVNSSFLYGDPAATYFGVGFSNWFGSLGFYFDAIQ